MQRCYNTGATMLKMLTADLRRMMTGLSRKDWFPQAPIALGVALMGLLYLLPVIDQAVGLQLHFRTLGSVRQDLHGINLSGISQLSISLFLLIISIGLWFRAKVAFLLSVLVLVIGAARWFLLSGTLVNDWLFGFDIVLLGSMLAGYRSFDRSTLQGGTWVALSTVVVLFGYTILGLYHLGDQFSPKIDTLAEALYMAVVTMSTVGFGDFTPITPDARLLIVSIIVLSITVLSTAVGATLIPAMIHRIENITAGRRDKVIRNDHYIIVGYSTLSSNTYSELVSRGQPVTVILRSQPDSTMFPQMDVDVVIGDGGDLETLRKAGAEKAKAILALLDDDSENAFVILAAKELKVKARTVAAVNDAKHLNRIRHVHPDMIIAPQVLGGELLTSMLMGERIDIKNLMDRMLGHSSAKPSSDKPD